MKSIISLSRLATLAIILLMAASCATAPSGSSGAPDGLIKAPAQSGSGGRTHIYSDNAFDGHGKPVFSGRLRERPAEAGSDFFVVETNGQGQPLKYYHIRIKGLSPDYSRPLVTLKDRTGDGFKGGVEFADSIMATSAPSDSEEALFVLTVAAGSVVVSTIGGATVGLVQGTYETIVETSKALFSKQEELLSFTLCEYDRRSRLKALRAFEAGPPQQEIFRVLYSYATDSVTPYKINVVDIIKY